MMVDGEAHRKADSSGQGLWDKGDSYDLSITLVDTRTGSTIAVLFHVCRHNGKLKPEDYAEAITAIRSRPDVICCAWGRGPEWKDAIKPAGREKLDGSDGIDLKEAVVQVMPSTRRAVSEQGDKRWSNSQNLWVPVMGLRRTAYHQALPDCVTEGIVASALGRALARPVASGGSL